MQWVSQAVAAQRRRGIVGVRTVQTGGGGTALAPSFQGPGPGAGGGPIISPLPPVTWQNMPMGGVVASPLTSGPMEGEWGGAAGQGTWGGMPQTGGGWGQFAVDVAGQYIGSQTGGRVPPLDGGHRALLKQRRPGRRRRGARLRSPGGWRIRWRRTRRNSIGRTSCGGVRSDGGG